MDNSCRPSYFTESFNEVFKEDFIHNTTLQMGKGSGANYALNFYFMGDKLRGAISENPNIFTMGISTNDDYYEMTSIGQNIKIGKYEHVPRTF